MTDAGIPLGPQEPARRLFDHFVRNMNVESAAAEFGLSPKNFQGKMRLDPQTRTLLSRLETNGMQRQLFESEFINIARLTGFGDSRSFEELNLPYFGQDPDACPTAPVAAPQVIAAENRDSEMQVSVSGVDDRLHFNEGEIIPVRIRSTEDCFLTIVGIDNAGDMLLLLPNSYHPDPVKLSAGRTLKIPSVEWKSQPFEAIPPHGTTEVRVFVTKQPLEIPEVNRERLALAKSVYLPLGNVKGIGVRPRVDTPEAERPAVPASDLRRVFSSDNLNQLYGPNGWATDRWTFTTHPKK